MKISEKLYALRMEKRLTQVEIAEIAGVSNRAVSNWESGSKQPKVRPLRLICTRFGLDINAFVDDEKNLEECYANISPAGGMTGEADAQRARIEKAIAMLSAENKEQLLQYAEFLAQQEAKKGGQ